MVKKKASDRNFGNLREMDLKKNAEYIKKACKANI
jgi:hypothetical protein